MTLRRFAILFGIVFLLAGVAGFIPGLSPVHMHRDVAIGASSRLALGLFPVNVLHNIVHLVFGVSGVLAAASVAAALVYARSVAIIYAVLTVCGLIPNLDTLFGLVPLYGNDIWLHAGLAIVAGYMGFVYDRSRHRSRADP